MNIRVRACVVAAVAVVKRIELWNNHLSTISAKKAACTMNAACEKVAMRQV